MEKLSALGQTERTRPTEPVIVNIATSIAKNTLFMLLVKIASPATSLLLVMCVAQFLGVSGLGKFLFAISFFVVFQNVASLGLEDLLIRNVAVNRSAVSKYIVNVSVIGLTSSTLMLTLMYSVVHLFAPTPDAVKLAMVLGIGLIPTTLTTIYRSIFTAFERVELTAYTICLESLAKISLGPGALFSGIGLVGLVGAMAFSRVLALLANLFFLFRFVAKPRFRLDVGFAQSVLRAVPVFALMNIFHAVFWNMDALMLSRWRGAADAGLYGSAFKLYSVWMILPQSFVITVLPILSQLYQSSSSSFKSVCQKSIKFMAIVIFPIVAGTLVLAEKILVLVYGKAFIAAAVGLRVAILMLIPNTGIMLFVYILVASHRQRICLGCLIGSSIMNLILNSALIPTFGYLGAIAGTLITLLLFVVVQYAVVQRQLFRIDFIRVLWKPTGATAIMAACTLALSPLPLGLVIPLSAIFYLLALLVLRVLTEDERRTLEELWYRQRTRIQG